MANAKTAPASEAPEKDAPEREVNIMSAKLTVKQVGDPKKAAASFAEGDQKARVLLGYIYGRAEGVKQGKNPDQMSVHKYLTGIFEAEPVFDPSRPISRSSKCILDESIQKGIEGMFDVIDDKTGQVLTEAKTKGLLSFDFKVAIFVIWSSAALGYSWAFKVMEQGKPADPLKELREMTFDNVKQLAAPKPAEEVAA